MAYFFEHVKVQPRRPFNVRNDLTVATIAYIVIMVWVFSMSLLWIDGISIDWAVIASICTGILGVGLSVFGKILSNSERLAKLEQGMQDISINIKDLKEAVEKLPKGRR